VTMRVRIFRNLGLKVLSIAPLIADALRAVFEESSVSEIFHGENQ